MFGELSCKKIQRYNNSVPYGMTRCPDKMAATVRFPFKFPWPATTFPPITRCYFYSYNRLICIFLNCVHILIRSNQAMFPSFLFLVGFKRSTWSTGPTRTKRRTSKFWSKSILLMWILFCDSFCILHFRMLQWFVSGRLRLSFCKMGCSIYNPHTPCGRFWESVPQGSVNFQMHLPYVWCSDQVYRKGSKHFTLKCQISLFTWNSHSTWRRCFLNLHRGCMEFKWSYPILSMNVWKC